MKSITEKTLRSFLGKNVKAKVKHYSYHKHLTSVEGIVSENDGHLLLDANESYSYDSIFEIEEDLQPLSFEGSAVKNHLGAIICEVVEFAPPKGLLYAGNARKIVLKMVNLFNDQHEIRNKKIEEAKKSAAALHHLAIERIDEAIGLIKMAQDDSLEDDFHPQSDPEGDIIKTIADLCKAFDWSPQDFANKYEAIMDSIIPGKEGLS